MPDSKITALTALTAADPANDMFPVVDVSDTTMAASGTTKRISINNILACSPSATLASATITGNLTLSAGTVNGVGYLNGSKVLTAGSTLLFDGTNLGIAGTGQFRFATSGGAIGDNTIGTENSFSMMLRCGRGSTSNIELASDRLVFSTSATERMRVDSSGNVGIGVTPSAWSGITALQISRGSFASDTGSYTLNQNVFNNGSNRYIATAAAMQFQAIPGTGFLWNIAPSGTAGNAITFTQAMTLDASGNLLLGKTVNSITTVGFQSTATGEVSAALAASTNAATQWTTYSTGAAAYRFYVGMGGTVFATNTTISAISDSRLKENVQDLDVGLNEILALKPRKFDWKAGKGKDIKGDRGFIAQEFETVFPNLIDEWKDNAPEGEAPYKSVRQDLIPVLVKAIQELTARVQTLETR